MAGSCMTSEPEVSSFGVDPVYLSTSALYNKDEAALGVRSGNPSCRSGTLAHCLPASMCPVDRIAACMRHQQRCIPLPVCLADKRVLHLRPTQHAGNTVRFPPPSRPRFAGLCSVLGRERCRKPCSAACQVRCGGVLGGVACHVSGACTDCDCCCEMAVLCWCVDSGCVSCLLLFLCCCVGTWRRASLWMSKPSH